MLAGKVNEMFTSKMLYLEMLEQAKWSTSIPEWHPRGEGDDPPPPDPANPAGPPKADDPPADKPGEKDASAQIATAYEKLRASEATVKDLKPLAAKATTLETENETLKAENARLKNEALEVSASKVITAKARDLAFHNPDRALQALRVYTDVDPLTLDSPEKVEAALKDMVKQEQHLVGSVAPSGGPINNGSGDNAGGNSAVNRAIRNAAGRP